MASIFWSRIIFSVPFGLHRTGEFKELHSERPSQVLLIDWLTLILQDGNNQISSHFPTFYGMSPSYALPNNVAIITLQVYITQLLLLFLPSFSRKMLIIFVLYLMFPNSSGTARRTSPPSLGTLIRGLISVLFSVW